MLLVKTYMADVLDSNLWEKMKIYSSTRCVGVEAVMWFVNADVLFFAFELCATIFVLVMYV